MDTKALLFLLVIVTGVFVREGRTDDNNSTTTTNSAPTSTVTDNTTTTTERVTPTTTTSNGNDTTNATLTSTVVTSTKEPTTTEATPKTHIQDTFGDFEYLFQTVETPLIFREAESYCSNDTSWGGFLVSIHAREENDFVFGLIGKLGYNETSWIGLVFEDNQYNWTDATAVDYTNWSEKPDQENTTFCAVMNSSDGNWTSANCSSQLFAFVCKRSSATTAGPTTTQGVDSGGGPNGLSRTALIGIIAGLVVVVVGLSLVAVLYFIKKKKKPKMDAFTLLDNDFSSANNVTVGDSY